MSRFFSLRGRLLVAMTLIFALGVFAALVSYRLEVHGAVRDIHARTLQAQASDVLEAIRDRPGGGIDLRLSEDWQKAYFDSSRQFSYTIYDAAGRVLAQAPNLAAPLANVLAGSARAVAPMQFIGVGASQRAVLALRDEEGRIAVVARGDFSRDALADSLFQEQAEQVFILAPFALLALVVIWFVSGWSLRPLARASSEAARVGPAVPELRITTEGLPKEIQPLVKAFNGALDRLARAYASERRLTADAAHELRTPLAVLNLRLQRARSSGKIDWPTIERELGQMSRLIAQLLDLTRKEALAREDQLEDLPVINLSRVIREASAMLVPLAESQKRRVHVELPDTALMRGNADDLRDMVRNLLENAIIHGRGTVSVTISPAHSPKPHWRVEICDEGDGVSLGQEELIFGRFKKLNSGSPGAGLGLAIVRQVATRHGGLVQFMTGRGCVLVELPATERHLDSAHEPAHATETGQVVEP